MVSMSSLTSASSAQTSSLESCQEEPYDGLHVSVVDDLPPTCTRSDGDAASQFGFEAKSKKGGLFKRFSRVLRMDRKNVPSADSERRGSM